MRRILIIIAALSTAIIANAQNKEPNALDSIKDKMSALTEQVQSLYNDIAELNKYVNKDANFRKVYQNPEDSFNELKEERDNLIEEIKGINTEKIDIENEQHWIDTLRTYYENGSLDDLYPHADTLTLRVHKQLLGKNYPKKLDDLLVMVECANLLKVEYDASRNENHRKRLSNVAESDMKWIIDGLLAAHEKVKKNVDNWTDYSLMGFITFRKSLQNELGVLLDTFPFLAEQARKKVELSKK